MKMDCWHVRPALSHYLRMKRLEKRSAWWRQTEDHVWFSQLDQRNTPDVFLPHTHTHLEGERRLALMCVTCLTCGHTPMRRLHSADIIEWFMHCTVIKMITALNRCYRQKRVRIIIFRCIFDQINTVFLTVFHTHDFLSQFLWDVQ